MIINILVDNPNSWICPYAKKLVQDLKEKHRVYFVHNQRDIVPRDCAFFLGCGEIVKKEVLAKNKHNLVVHASPLPQGKGWSPLTWQILGGENEIPVTLFEAIERVDSGDIYFQEVIRFDGHELIGELRQKLGEKTIELVKRFIAEYPNVKGKKQEGEESFYRKRTAKDSELNPNKTIAEQFNLLRVADNDRYPAFFKCKGHKYILKMYKDKEIDK